MGPLWCPETSVVKYHSAPYNIPLERKPNLGNILIWSDSLLLSVGLDDLKREYSKTLSIKKILLTIPSLSAVSSPQTYFQFIYDIGNGPLKKIIHHKFFEYTACTIQRFWKSHLIEDNQQQQQQNQ